MAPFLLCRQTELHVFRATILSALFALAIGQNAVLLCKVLCDPHVAAHTGCHDTESTDGPRVMAHDDCADAVPVDTAFLKEDVRRTAPDSHGDQAIATPRYSFAGSTIDGRPDRKPRHLPALEKRPLVTALRI